MLRRLALAVLIVAVALFLYSLFRDDSQLTETSSVVSGIALVLALASHPGKKETHQS